jgi:hypothetical protein
MEIIKKQFYFLGYGRRAELSLSESDALKLQY